MKTELKNNSNTLALLPAEIKEKIIKENWDVIFNTEIDIKKRLFIFFSMLGLPANIAGYDYIEEALMICIKNNYKLPNTSKILYPEIAKKYDKTPSQVERSIRHAISISMQRANAQILFYIFGYAIDKKATNSEYLAQIAKFLGTMCN